MGQVGGGGDCSCRQVKSWAKLVVEGTAPVGRLYHGPSWWWRGLLLSAGYIMGQVGGGGDCSCRQVKSLAKLVVEGTAPVGRLYHGPSWWWRGLLLSAG